GLGCLCTPAGECASPPARRICTADCNDTPCASGAVCADLPGSRCLAACQTNAQCAAGFVCMTLRAQATNPTLPWTRGCLPVGVRRDVGASCRDANGALASELCTTATCADIGALGVCSAACDTGLPCPDGTACALLPGGAQLCLPTCTVKEDCAADPLLG